MEERRIRVEERKHLKAGSYLTSFSLSSVLKAESDSEGSLKDFIDDDDASDKSDTVSTSSSSSSSEEDIVCLDSGDEEKKKKEKDSKKQVGRRTRSSKKGWLQVELSSDSLRGN